MARIVYAWELGGGFGHIQAFLPLARRLKDAGHDVIFINKDLLNAERELNREGFRSLQAPLFQGKLVGLPEPPVNFSEILLRFGFLREEHLAGLVKAWLELYRLLAPDLIIADYGPATLLAARIAEISAATFGTGFCRPPPVHPLPNLRPWMELEENRLANADGKVMDTVNRVLRTFAKPPIGRVADLFSVGEDFLCTFAELDHYPERPGAKYWGAVYSQDQGEEINWPGREEFRIFGYVKPTFPELRNFIRQLGLLKKHEIILFCPGLAPAQVEKYASPRLTIRPSPVRLDRLLSRCDLAVCHAGHGTVCGMLQAGIPLLLLPTNLEQYLTGWRVEEYGAGRVIAEPDEATDYLAPMGEMLKRGEYRAAARKFAARYAGYTQEAITARILARLLELAG
jgi:hypothetical protein